MGSFFKNLEKSIKTKNETEVTDHFQCIINNSSEFELKDITFLEDLWIWDDLKIRKIAMNAIAELSKAKTNRAVLSQTFILEKLVDMICGTDIDDIMLGCRAVGNICYENDTARKIVYDYKGVSTIAAVLSNEKFQTNAKFMSSASGCLLNLIYSKLYTVNKAFEQQILKIFETILDKRTNDYPIWEDCFMHFLLIFNIFIENGSEIEFSETFFKRLLKILEQSENVEICGLCLELFQTFAERNDQYKLTLSKCGICELLYKLLEKYKPLIENDEQKAMLKNACDLIVLLLTGDESMIYLYQEGNGTVFKNMVSWLDSDDEELLISAVLAIGNFARNDKHCIQMVETRLSDKLLALMKKYNTENSSVRVQHALLSAIRNILVLPQNKPKLIDSNVVDIIYPMVNFGRSHVTFKLLGTLRMAVDGQEKVTQDLISRKSLLEKLSEWCLVSDHPGIQSEAFRLIAWLIKNCGKPEFRLKVLEAKDCLGCILKIIPLTPHPVMLNEAFLSIRLMFEACRGDQKLMDQFSTGLQDANFFNTVAFLILKRTPKLDKETVENILELVELLSTSKAQANQMKKSDLKDALQALQDKEEYKHLHTKIRNIISAVVDT